MNCSTPGFPVLHYLPEFAQTPTPVLLPGKSHWWRSLVGCSPWGRKESDMTEWIPCHFSLSCIGEGNGNPLQCLCLENPRDGGAWWAAIYGVAQSRTWLKWLSSSISSMSIVLVMLPNHLVPFSYCIQSFPSPGSFSTYQLFTSDGQCFGVQLQHQFFQ